MRTLPPSSLGCVAGSSPSPSVSGGAPPAVTWPTVTRFRSAALALLLCGFAVWAPSATLAQEEPPPADGPAIVVEAEGTDAATGEEAWTFRFLVPTVLVMAGLGIAGTIVLYGVRVRGRYRVVR